MYIRNSLGKKLTIAAFLFPSLIGLLVSNM